MSSDEHSSHDLLPKLYFDINAWMRPFQVKNSPQQSNYIHYGTANETAKIPTVQRNNTATSKGVKNCLT